MFDRSTPAGVTSGRKWAAAAILCGLAVLVVFTFRDVFVAEDDVLPGRDSVNLYVWEIYTRAVLATGKLPFWNPFHSPAHHISPTFRPRCSIHRRCCCDGCRRACFCPRWRRCTCGSLAPACSFWRASSVSGGWRQRLRPWQECSVAAQARVSTTATCCCCIARHGCHGHLASRSCPFGAQASGRIPRSSSCSRCSFLPGTSRAASIWSESSACTTSTALCGRSQTAIRGRGLARSGSSLSWVCCLLGSARFNCSRRRASLRRRRASRESRTRTRLKAAGTRGTF